MGLKKKLLHTAATAAATKATARMARRQGANVVRAAEWATDRVRPRRRRSSLGRTAALGLGAVVMALPAGLWLGRQLMGRRDDHMDG